MKILQITARTSGGAGIAALRLHRQFRSVGFSSTLLCLKDSAGIGKKDKHVLAFIDERKISYLPNRLKYKLASIETEKHLKGRPPGFEIFSSSTSPFDITTHPAYKEADLIHLHWSATFLDHRTFFQNNTKPLIMTLHDMFPFTGGCHHSDGCMKFKTDCDPCPQLYGTINEHWAAEQMIIKENGFNHKSQIHIVSPSLWLKNLSGQSKLLGSFPHKHIPNGFDTTVFINRDKTEARKRLNIPLNKPVLLFVAEDIGHHRKGFSILTEAINELPGITMLAIGINKNPSVQNHIHFTGRINDEETMSWIYNAADMFVLPSLAENLPNTIAESLLCGVPVVAFGVGGIPEMIDHNQNGYLCNEINSTALLNGIKYLLRNKVQSQSHIREAAVNKYSLKKAADEYISIYRNLYNLNKPNHS